MTHKIVDERVDELTLEIDGERVERLTRIIHDERADELTIKIDGERVGRLTHINREERVDGLCQIQIDGERNERLTCKIREERVDGLPFKIDEDRADRWTDKTCEERADGWTYQKVAERMLVDGDGSESGGIRWSHFMSPENTEEIRILENAGLCAMRKVLATSGSSHSSTELQECAIRQWEERMTWVAAVASVAMASMALMVALWLRWRRRWIGGVDGVEWWRRMVVTGVFDAEGTDVEVPLCPQ